jgi:phospholipase C
VLGLWIYHGRQDGGRGFAVKASPGQTVSLQQGQGAVVHEPAGTMKQPPKLSTYMYILPVAPTVIVGSTVQLQAFSYDRSGVIANVTATSNWKVIEPSIASVVRTGSSGGLVTALAPGEVLVQARVGGTMGFASITVVSSLDLPPPGLTANASDGQVTLTWTALPNSTTFNVLRATQQDGPFNTIATVSTPSYTDMGLADGTSYYYVVRAHYEDGGHSGNSHEAVGTPLAPGAFNVIQHIVYLVKENHSFDSLFGLFPGANGATMGKISTGQTVQLQELPDPPPNDLGHLWRDANLAEDAGRMDRFDLISGGDLNGALLPYSEFYQKDIPNYWTYASKFVLGDAMYSSIASSSYPGHLYIMSAQSVGAIDDPVSPTTSGGWGCDASSDTTVATVTNTDPQVLQNPFPCYGATSLAYALQNAGVSWKSYAPSKNDSAYALNALRAFSQIFDSSLWKSNVVTQNDFVNDAMSPNMPAVSWLNPDAQYDEHPVHSVCEGENWTVQQINAIMRGPNWNSTAIFIVWDDFGGFYDHVPPPRQDIYGYSIRVPLIIISPYAKQTIYGQKGYITHSTYELSSVLRFIEERFGVAPLTARDATANDILDAFDFSQPPLPPVILQQRTCP